MNYKTENAIVYKTSFGKKDFPSICVVITKGYYKFCIIEDSVRKLLPSP